MFANDIFRFFSLFFLLFVFLFFFYFFSFTFFKENYSRIFQTMKILSWKPFCQTFTFTHPIKKQTVFFLFESFLTILNLKITDVVNCIWGALTWYNVSPASEMTTAMELDTICQDEDALFAKLIYDKETKKVLFDKLELMKKKMTWFF